MTKDEITVEVVCPYDGCAKEGEYFATVRIESGIITISTSVETCNHCGREFVLYGEFIVETSVNKIVGEEKVEATSPASAN